MANSITRVNARKRGATWSYRFEKERIDGKRQFVEKGGFETKEAALEAGRKAFDAYQTGGKSERPKHMSLADFLDLWYERTKLSCRNNTLEMREKNIRLHLKPALGSYRLASLTPALIDEFVKQKRKDGYSFETVDRMLNNLKTALDYAVWPMEMLRENPARLIKVPGKEYAPVSSRRPRRRIEDKELAAIFERYPFGNTFHMPFVIGLYFGTRIGETLGLLWTDCDTEKRILAIRRQLQRLSMTGHHSCHYLCDVKTESSNRKLSFDAAVILPLLKHWKRQQAANEIEYGENYFYNYLVPAKDFQGRAIDKIVSLEKCYPAPGKRLDFLCTQPNGKYIKPCTLSYQCKRVRELGVKDFDFHCLRHTNLTMLGESQIAPNDIMSRAGHTDYDTTNKYYVDDRPEMQEQPVKVLTSKLKDII